MADVQLKNPEEIKPLQRLWHLIAKEKKEVVAIYFYAIMSGLVQLSVPVGVQAIVGFVLGASMVTSIFILIMLLVLGVLMVGIFQMNQMKIIEKIQQNIFVHYSFAFAETIPRFDLKKTDKYYLPEKVNRFFDVMNVQKGFSKILLDMPIAIIQIVFGLLLLSFYHPAFIIFGVFLLFILWLIGKLYSKKGIITSLLESNYKYAVAGWLEEMARVIHSFKLSQGSHINLSKTDGEVSNYLISRTAHFKVLLFQYKTLVSFKVVITAAMLFIGSYLLVNQQLNVGEFIAAEIVILMVIGAVEKLIVSLESVYDVITGLEKLASITESPLEQSGSMPFADTDEAILVEFEDFSFGFYKNKLILKNINCTIQPNGIASISGSSGSGKSMLLKVLSGNYSDFSGSILLNKIPISNYDLEQLRGKTGIYSHYIELFQGTVWENISLGRSQITINNVTAIARELGIETFLSSLHNGFETMIGPMGKKLPSTIAKKILLLRALAGQPKLLLLEEPWIGLDEKTKNKMQQYLLNKKYNHTVFIVNNDEAFARQCDYNILLENGSIHSIKTKV